jgi:large subunit ribosomal protein L19
MVQQITFQPGDVIKVHQRIQEGDKSRVQIFRGVVLAIKGRGENKMFTVQKMVGQVSVQRIWPVSSPLIEKIELVEKPRKRVRRAKLNYLKVKKK